MVMSAGASLGHTIVVGGSIAGLTVAFVLSRLFARVTIVDRDRLPADSANRPGVGASFLVLGPYLVLGPSSTDARCT
jgi:glycine/D-amino acid oxidase-like deaminating enzyme